MALPFDPNNREARNNYFFRSSWQVDGQSPSLMLEQLFAALQDNDYTDDQLQTVYEINLYPHLKRAAQTAVDNTLLSENERVNQLISDYFNNTGNYKSILGDLLSAYTASSQALLRGSATGGRQGVSGGSSGVINFINNVDGSSQQQIEGAAYIKFLFEAFLRNNDNRSPITNDPDDIAELEARANGEGGFFETGAFAAVAAATQGLPAPSTPQDEAEVNALRQCAVITDLFQDGSYSRVGYPAFAIRQSTLNTAVSVPLLPVTTDSTPYLNRIYPVWPGSLPDQSLFFNRLVSSTVNKNYFAACGFGGASNDHKTLNLAMRYVYYYVDENENPQIKEIDLKLNSDKAAAGNAYNLFVYEQALNYATQGTQEAIQQQNQLGLGGFSAAQLEKKIKDLNDAIYNNAERSVGKYYLKNAKVVYEGTNPSTARSDVKLELSFIISGLTDLSEVSVKPDDITLPNNGDIKLQDLVTLPITGRDDGGPGSHLNNQYNPNYNRVRLVLQPGTADDQNLIIDLTTIDHKISRESATGITTFDITYRGYFESMMNMPFNDALADNRMLANRDRRNKKLTEAVKDGCKPETIRELLRINQRIIGLEAEQISRRSLVTRLLERNKMHKVQFTEEYTSTTRFIDPTKRYVKKIFALSGDDQELLNTELAEEMRDDPEDEAELFSGRTSETFCVYLGDLMEVLTDCLYEAGTATMRPNVRFMNLRFIVGPIQIPDPNNINNLIAINPLQIPIELKFLVEWFHDTVVKKGLTFYPVGTFIRDLVERLVNDVIYETCFTTLLPDEVPPTLRVSYFSSTRSAFFQNVTNAAANQGRAYYLNLNSPYGPGIDPGTRALIAKAKQFRIDTANGKNTTNYCVIYMQNPPYYREIRNQQGGQRLQDDPYVPTIVYGTRNKECNYLTNVSFAKTDSPFLREARYFNDTYGNLSLLSNVYDLSFSFVDKKAHTFLFPGNLINFVLKDWGSIRSSATPIEQADPSNPHNKDTPATILGLGGYFIIKKVEYIRGETPQDYTINITAKFLGSDGQREARENKRTIDIINSDTADCIEKYKEAVRAFNGLLEEDDERKLQQAVSKAQPPAASSPPPAPPTTTQTPTRVQQVAASGPTPEQQALLQERTLLAVTALNAKRAELIGPIYAAYSPGTTGVIFHSLPSGNTASIEFKRGANTASGFKMIISKVEVNGETIASRFANDLSDPTIFDITTFEYEGTN